MKNNSFGRFRVSRFSFVQFQGNFESFSQLSVNDGKSCEERIFQNVTLRTFGFSNYFLLTVEVFCSFRKKQCDQNFKRETRFSGTRS